MGSFMLAIQALKGAFLRLLRAFKTLSLRVTQHGEAMRDEFSRFAPSNEVVGLDNKLERAIQTFRDQLKSIDSSFKVKVEKGPIDVVLSESHVTMTVLRDCIDKAVAPLQEAMAEVMAVLADTEETEYAAHKDEGVHGFSLIEDEDAHTGRTGDTSLYPGGAFSKRVPVHFHDSDESIFAKGDNLLKGGPIKKLLGMAMTSLQQRAKWEEDETPLDPSGDHTDSSSTELQAFFKSLEDEVSLKSAQTGAGKGRVHRIRGLLSGELYEQELKLMDDTTKKDIKRIIRRLPSLGVGAWRCAPLLPWRVQCPVCVCAALAAGSGGFAQYLVLCLSCFPLPAPRVPRCLWRAVPSGCPLPSLAGTPFYAVCAFRVLGPVALLVVPACPLRVCALALPRRPLPPLLGGVACALRAVPALGAGRAVPRGPCPSASPAPLPCSVWRAWGGAVRSRFPRTWLGVVGVAEGRPRGGCLPLLRGASGVRRSPSPDCPPTWRAVGVRYPRAVGAGVRVWGPFSVPLVCMPCGGCAPRGGSVAFVCRGAGWGGGGACAVPPVCAAGGGL